MQITKHPASRGIFWLLEGLRILSRQPVGLVALTVLALLTMSLPSIVPAIGSLITFAIMPAIYVGLMHIIRTADNGELPTPGMLIIAFRELAPPVWQALLMLGAINAILTLIAFTIAPSMGLQETPVDPATVTADDVLPVLQSVLIFVIIYTPVQMAFWYAPLFVGWHGQTVTKSLFYSLVAVWRNKGAFAVLMLSWFLAFMLAVLALQLIAALVGLSPNMITLLIVPLFFFGLSAAYCSFWVTYRDVIQAGNE